MRGPGEDHPEYAATLAAIGEALSLFTNVEMAVQLIFTELAWMQRDHDAYLVMASISSFDVRVRMTGAFVAQRQLGKPLEDRWDALAKRTQKLALKRAELAHFAIVREADMIGDPITGISIQPYFSLSSKDLKRGRLKRREIEERGRKFAELAHELGLFLMDIRTPLIELRTKSLEA